MKITIDVSEITKSLSKDLADNEQLGRDIAGKLAFDLQAGLKLRTPVDTGTARNGWDVDLAGEYPIVMNNVEYIGYLNEGHSDQAPAGFVEAEIDKVTKS